MNSRQSISKTARRILLSVLLLAMLLLGLLTARLLSKRLPQEAAVPDVLDGQPADDLAFEPTDVVIFDEQLTERWQDWSYSTLLDPNQHAYRRSGSRALHVRYDEAYAGVQLVRDYALDAKQFEALHLAVRAGAERQLVYVALLQQDMEWTAKVAVQPPVGGWSHIRIPMQQFGNPSFVRGVVIQEGAGAAGTEFYIDDVALLGADTPAEGEGPSLMVDLNQQQGTISPYIYGINFADPAFAREIDLPINRWGGNAVTRYNWQLDVSNRASDWYFMNVANKTNVRALPDSAVFNDFVVENRAIGADTVLTLPLIGWTPKSRARTCTFSVADFAAQSNIDPEYELCGSGVGLDGEPLAGDPTITSRAIDETFVADWIEYLTARYGTAAEGGVRFYGLDNEPMLWHVTHRDVHPQPVTYEEILQRTLQYAAAAKQADSSAKTLGPVVWGWSAYFYSAHDLERGDWQQAQDRKKHGDVPFVEWYLQQMAAYEAEHGVRLLDYLDLHFYPQQAGVPLAVAGGADIQQLRLRSTRALWDPTYIDESWIDQPVMLIPRMRQWVADNYPGTGLSLSEYNWGGLEDINGALVQADILGIFGREGLDLAMLWSAPQPDQPGAYAFRIYRNYDGRGAKFGDVSLHAHSDDWDRLAVYAARRSGDGATTIIVINKTRMNLNTTLHIAGADDTQLQTFQYSAERPRHIVQMPQQTLSAGQLATQFPAQSITLFALTPP